MRDKTIKTFISLGPLCYIISNICDRSDVVVPPPERVVGHEEDEDACPYHAAPIHITRRWVWTGREELEEPEHREETQRDDVDRVASFTKVESRRWEKFTAKSLMEDT